MAISEFKHHHQEPEREKPRREPKGCVDDILGEPKVSRRLVAHSSFLLGLGERGAGCLSQIAKNTSAANIAALDRVGVFNDSFQRR